MVKKILPKFSFFLLCLIYGCSYAFVSKALPYFEGSILNSLRMWFAFFFSILILIYFILNDKNFFKIIQKSLKSGNTPIFLTFLCGIINYGFPHSLITLSQNKLPSVLIIISQPFVSLFTFLMSPIFLFEEKITFKKLIPQLLAIFGSILTAKPSFNLNENNNSNFEFLPYLLLIISLISFSFGTIFIKAYLNYSNSILLCVFQLFGSAIYSTIFSILKVGYNNYFNSIFNNPKNLIWPLLLGIFFTGIGSFLFVYIVKELGTVIASFTNFGQIVIGIIIGVLFLKEWENYSKFDIFLSLIGLIFIFISLIFGFKFDSKFENTTDNVPLIDK